MSNGLYVFFCFSAASSLFLYAMRSNSVKTLTIRSFAAFNINLSASSIVCCMVLITSMLKLCELATDHGTSSECTEGPRGCLPGAGA